MGPEFGSLPDAFYLSMLIKDNIDEDTSNIALKYFAKAEMYLGQNKENEAILLLDTLENNYKSSSLIDDVLFLKAKIYEKQNNVDKTIDNLKKIEIFRHSILKKAFEGKLVPQNKYDEPASKLLQKIREEKKIYEAEQKKIAKTRNKIKKPMESNKSVKEILENSKKLLFAEEVWQMSKHKNDIEEFYAELKKLSDNLIEIKQGNKSFLSIKK